MKMTSIVNSKKIYLLPDSQLKILLFWGKELHKFYHQLEVENEIIIKFLVRLLLLFLSLSLHVSQV